MEQTLQEKLEQLKIARERLIEYYEDLEKNLNTERKDIESKLEETENLIGNLGSEYYEIFSAQQKQVEQNRKAAAFSKKLDEFLREREQYNESREISYQLFFNNKENLKEGLFAGYFNSSDFLISKSAIESAKRYLGDHRNLQAVLSDGIEIRNIHTLIAKSKQFDKDILIQAAKEWMKNSADGIDYDTHVPTENGASYSIVDMLNKAIQDRKISSDLEFVEVYDRTMKWREAQSKRYEEFTSEMRPLLDKRGELEVKEYNITERISNECRIEQHSKLEQIDKEIKETEELIKHENKNNNSLQEEILKIVATLQDNPLNLEMINQIGKRETPDKVLKIIESNGLLPICEEANKYYKVVKCFKKGEILLRDIDEKYFNNAQFANKIISISKDKLEAHVREQTKGLKDDEQVDPELIAKIKAQEDKIIKIIEGKKELVRNTRIESAKAAIDSFEV